jgi:hypothetical protein
MPALSFDSDFKALGLTAISWELIDPIRHKTYNN